MDAGVAPDVPAGNLLYGDAAQAWADPTLDGTPVPDPTAVGGPIEICGAATANCDNTVDYDHQLAVFIPDTPSMTFCISTQVGCAMSCGFCLTGKMGLVRNLTAGEIAGQVRVLAATTGLLDSPFNIVLS